MEKNYVENSLKRFLKRKVKITLGFVVAFMISGTVGFAEPIIVGEENHINNKWLEGIGSQKEDILQNDIVIKNDNAEINFTISKDLINNNKGLLSTEVIKNVNNSIELINKALNKKTDFDASKLPDDNGVYQLGLSIEGEVNTEDKTLSGPIQIQKGNYINKGFLNRNVGNTNGSVVVLYGKDSKMFNYGIIKSNGHGQGLAASGCEAYNYGIILSGNAGQTIFGNGVGEADKKGGKIWNYGFIQGFQSIGIEEGYIYNYGIINDNKTVGAQIFEQNAQQQGIQKGYNYGLLISGKAGQKVQNSHIELNNYGVIVSKEEGQDIISNKESIAYNYGVIKSDKIGQMLSSNNKKSTIYNYGLIESKKTGQEIYNNGGNSYNYGIIKTTTNDKNYAAIKNDGSTAEHGYAENSGLIITEDGNAFIGNVTNNGIVFSKDDVLENNNKTINNGVYIVNKNGNTEIITANTTKQLEESKNISEITENNIFINNVNKDSNVTLTVDKDTLDSKHITAVFGKESKGDTAVKANSNLTLNNSSIVGYFEKNGTLLNVNGNLTLDGNSVINAITGNEYTGYTGDKLDDVVAVKLSKNGKLEIKDNSKVLGTVEGNGTLVYENTDNKLHSNVDVDSILINTTKDNTTNITLENITLKDSKTNVNNAGKLVIDNQSSEKLKDKEISTSITLANNINIEKGIDGSSSSNGIELILGDGQNSSDNSIKVGGEILLGQADDTIIINNILGKYDENQKAVVIDGGENKDTVILKNSNGNHDTFDYALKNIETLDLNNQTWKIGENASIEFGNNGTTRKAPDKITVQNGTLMGEMKFDINENGNTAEFSNDNIDDVLGKTDFSTEKGKEGYLQLGIGENSELQAGAEYNIDEDTKDSFTGIPTSNIKVSGIFSKGTGENEIRVKTAQEMGINGRYSELYNQMLENADKEEVRNVLNNVNSSDIADVINSKGAMADTLATSGYKITRDISNSFISSVNEWNKKANKGEWLANAKYIGSDMEYDGTSTVNGYESDINSMVGMAEYGISDNTSYGVVLGGGDTEVDVTGAGTLEGDNYYIGAYAKHSVNGFDLVGNLGYTISDLEVDGNGSADSSAITLAGYVKRDIRLSETIKIEPNLAFTYDYIMQDDAEGNGVKVENKDIHVFEATAGMNIVKEFAFNNGNLELKAGIKYSMADINRNEETIMVNVLDTGNTTLGNPEVDKTRGTAHIEFDYEHETGFGVNGKYETMWSDSGDDSRVTVGISYRF